MCSINSWLYFPVHFHFETLRIYINFFLLQLISFLPQTSSQTRHQWSERKYGSNYPVWKGHLQVKLLFKLTILKNNQPASIFAAMVSTFEIQTIARCSNNNNDIDDDDNNSNNNNTILTTTTQKYCSKTQVYTTSEMDCRNSVTCDYLHIFPLNDN